MEMSALRTAYCSYAQPLGGDCSRNECLFINSQSLMLIGQETQDDLKKFLKLRA